ncbi:MAG: glycosyltransferase [Muribaculum sp.]|nr:glycosyltransferase [Muribaculum sp.]
MKIVLLNLILHTAEKGVIPKHDTNRDCMIYNMARGFVANGHEVTLLASEEFRPALSEVNPFKVMYFPSRAKAVFKPHLLPFPKGLYSYLKRNAGEIDLIISSEVFSIGSLVAAVALPKRLLIWHELSCHQKFMHHIPSKVWYNIVAKIFLNKIPVVCRSERARAFLSPYLPSVSKEIVDHGANSEIFKPLTHNTPEKRFIVISQLIGRKRVDRIIKKFADFIKTPGYNDYTLDIIGRGPQQEELRQLIDSLGASGNIILRGFLSHDKLAPLSAKSLALLVFTEQDLNMVSIPESIVNGTPVITNSVPTTSSFIAENGLGIVNDDWGTPELIEMATNYDRYHARCIALRDTLTEKGCAKKLVDIWKCDFLQ